MRLVPVYDTPGAVEVLYELLKERSTEDDPYVNISHRALPSMEEHKRFIESEPYRYWYLIVEDWHAVGYISATRKNEIGIVLFKRHRGKGYGSTALRLFLDLHTPLPAVPSERSGKWLANINPENQASAKLFAGAGFGLVQETYQLEART